MKIAKTKLQAFLREKGLSVGRELKDDVQKMKEIVRDNGWEKEFLEVNGYSTLWDDDDAKGNEPEPKQSEPEPKQSEPEPKQSEPEPKQSEPEPKQSEPEPEPEPEPKQSEPEPEPKQNEPEPNPNKDPKPSIEERLRRARIQSEQNPSWGSVSDSGSTPPIEVKKKPRAKRGKKTPETDHLEGSVLIILIDVLIPTGMSLIFNMLAKKNKIEAHELMLNEKEHKKLEPLADAAAAHLQINSNPLITFGIVSMLIYGQKLYILNINKTK